MLCLNDEDTKKCSTWDLEELSRKLPGSFLPDDYLSQYQKEVDKLLRDKNSQQSCRAVNVYEPQ